MMCPEVILSLSLCPLISISPFLLPPCFPCLYPIPHKSLVTTVLLSVTTHSTFLDFTYMWDYVIFVCVWLTALYVLQVHPCCHQWQGLILFKSWIVFHCVCVCILFIHSSIIGHLGHFHILATINNAEMNIKVQWQWFYFIWLCTQKWDCWLIW